MRESSTRRLPAFLWSGNSNAILGTSEAESCHCKGEGALTKTKQVKITITHQGYRVRSHLRYHHFVDKK